MEKFDNPYGTKKDYEQEGAPSQVTWQYQLKRSQRLGWRGVKDKQRWPRGRRKKRGGRERSSMIKEESGEVDAGVENRAARHGKWPRMGNGVRE